MAGGREFSADRFEELVLYISWKTQDDPSFGRVKLAKVLFYSDLAAFAEEGQALTGATYYHYKFGPFPRALYEAEERIHDSGRAEVERISQGDRAGEQKILPQGTLDAEVVFEKGWHQPLVDSYIEKISALPSWKVSDESHDHPGWALTVMNEEIPYHVAHMSRRRPTERDRARGEVLALEHGWP